LEILYDNRTQPFEFKDGAAQIPEPRQGQVVTLILKRKATDQQTYAVVLKVNGENTLGRQRLADLQCRKWIIAPKCPPIVLRGFQMDENVAAMFRVASPAESAARAIDYGRDVGTISLTVFGEHPKDLPPDTGPQTDSEEDMAILMRGVFPDKANDF